jgi:hypothetical protein
MSTHATLPDDYKIVSSLATMNGVRSNDEEDNNVESVFDELCWSTYKKKEKIEYRYKKLGGKIISRWTCCGAQSRTHPPQKKEIIPFY